MTQFEAVIDAFNHLGGIRTIREIEDWVTLTYGGRWKSFGTCLADMVSVSYGGNPTSTISNEFRILKRVGRGTYCLINDAP